MKRLFALIITLLSLTAIYGQTALQNNSYVVDSVLVFADSLQNEASESYEKGDNGHAIDVLKLAIKILNDNKLTASEQYAAIIHDYAVIDLMYKKDADSFEINIDKAIRLKYKIYGLSNDYFWSIQCKADGFYYLGRISPFPQNLTYYRKSIGAYHYLIEKDGSGYVGDYVKVLNDYSAAMESISIDSAIKISQQSLSIERQFNIADSLVTLSNLIKQYKENWQYDSATICANVVLKNINDDVLASRTATIYEDVASIYGRTKRYQIAIDYAYKALHIANAKYGDNSSIYYRILGNIASYLFFVDVNKSLRIFKKIYHSKNGDKLTSSFNLANIYGLIDRDSCLYYTTIAWNLIKKETISDIEKLSGWDKFKYLCQESQLLDITMPIRYIKYYLDNDNYKRMALETVLFYNSLYGNSKQYNNCDFDYISSSLKYGEVAIEIWEDKFCVVDSTKSDYAFIVRRNWKSPKIVILSKSKMLSEIYDKTKFTNTYNPLYEDIWKDIETEADLKDGERVFLSVNDNDLERMPIEYICNKDWEYIGNVYDIRRVTSIENIPTLVDSIDLSSAVFYGGLNYKFKNEDINNVSIDLSKAYSHGNSFNLSDSIKSELRSTTSYLPWTKYEVDTISNILKSHSIDNVCVISGDNGTEHSFKAFSGNSPRLLHIATHGILFDQSKLDSTIWNLQDFDTYCLDHTSLLFSGVLDYINVNSRNSDNGILTSKEIANLDLRNTDLLVLSACDSGLGGISNFGIIGLRKAFKLAGVKTIIMSLKKVDDYETSLFMIKFYEELIRTRSKHKAFHNANLYYQKNVQSHVNWFVMLD